jgi:hypothetical protein
VTALRLNARAVGSRSRDWRRRCFDGEHSFLQQRAGHLRHPDFGVDASNRAEVAVGVVRDPRRVGYHLVADLLIRRHEGIRAVRDLRWRAVSAGYDYVRLGTGRAAQADIRANHVAVLNPNESARCGDVCRIGAARPRAMREVAWGVAARDQITNTPGKRDHGRRGR